MSSRPSWVLRCKWVKSRLLLIQGQNPGSVSRFLCFPYFPPHFLGNWTRDNLLECRWKRQNNSIVHLLLHERVNNALHNCRVNEVIKLTFGMTINIRWNKILLAISYIIYTPLTSIIGKITNWRKKDQLQLKEKTLWKQVERYIFPTCSQVKALNIIHISFCYSMLYGYKMTKNHLSLDEIFRGHLMLRK